MRQKAIAQAAITGGKKREVVFDEEARFEYLTGFRKRKQERRKFGLGEHYLLTHTKSFAQNSCLRIISYASHEG